jgi:nuclear pore complex protein Nup107
MPEATTGYRKFTTYGLMQGIRSGKAMGMGTGVLGTVDPDATTREKGASLAPDDTVCYPNANAPFGKRRWLTRGFI